jgi:capsular polysaccharide transport system permease protein
MNAEQPFLTPMLEAQPRSWLTSQLKKRQWFLLFVVLPTLLAAVYYGFIASDVYTSESRFVIKSPDQKHSQTTSLANLIQTTGLSGGQEQTNEVLDYVRSRDALQGLEKAWNVRSAYSQHGDIFSRFPGPLASNSFEDMYKYYDKMVSARLDTETGTAVLTAKAFTPRMLGPSTKRCSSYPKRWLTSSICAHKAGASPKLNGKWCKLPNGSARPGLL